MIYSDEELKRWWQGLSVMEQRMTLERMAKQSSGTYVDFAESLRKQWDKQVIPFTPKQLQVIRKWAR